MVAVGVGPPSTASAATAFEERVSPQRIIRLILVDGAALREIARDQGEMIDVKRRRAIERVLSEIALESSFARTFEPRQGDVRRVAPLFRRKAEPRQRALDLAVQMLERVVALDTDPKLAQAEMPDGRERDLEARRMDLAERGIDILRLAFIDLADEAQGEMVI